MSILKNLGYVPDEVLPADIDETEYKNELPRCYVNRVARRKLDAIASLRSDDFVAAADTIGIIGKRIMRKAHSEDDVRDMLKIFSGRIHTICICIRW